MTAEIFHGDVAASPAVPATRHGIRVLGILSALMGFASISTDFYLPAMPRMATALHTDAGTVGLTISGYLIGFSLGQLLWGPISDRHGRRLPIAIGLVLFIVGSVGCALSDSAWTMIAWRVVQAGGASAGVVLSRAMVRDLYVGNRAAQMLSTLITVMAVAPLLGPILGAQIMALAGWRAIFWTLVGVGLLTLASLVYLPETLPATRRSAEPLSGAVLRYGKLLRNRTFLGYGGAGGLFYGAMFAYVAGTPSAYITYHHVPAELYGLLFGVGILGIMTTNTLNGRLVMRYGSDWLMVRGTAAAALFGLATAVAASTSWGGLAGLAVPLFLFVSTTGFIVANSIAGAMAGFPERAGAVSALVGAMQYGSGMVCSALVAAFADGTPWSLGWVVALAAVGSFLCAWLVVPSRRAVASR